ncbi:helicase-related protein [Candidatus Hodarchaeum mangrovi]
MKKKGINSLIMPREYQKAILKQLKQNYDNFYHTITEVDTGMGKRVLMYLIVKETFSDKRVLLLLHSTSSYFETNHYFTTQYGGFREDEFQGISSQTPSWLRIKILENKKARIIMATPQTFMNVFEKMSKKPLFDIIIINEVDKVVRRQGDDRLFIYPYNKLIPYFVEKNCWVVGMTGTMRDHHVLYDNIQETIKIKSEYSSLESQIPDLHIIRMENLIQETDISDYIRYTMVSMVSVEPSKELLEVLNLIDGIIDTLREEIIEETKKDQPRLIENLSDSQLSLVSGMLSSSSGQHQKYQGLLLIRKYCTAMQTSKFRKFLYRLMKFGLTKEVIRNLPEKNPKIEKVLQLIQNESLSSKSVVICSYLDTAAELDKFLSESGLQTYQLTGRVRDKISVINNFKAGKQKSVLIMTSIGERDLDIPQAELLIVFDSINTTKTMYQRMKRTRGGRVVFLYYDKTFEEQKVTRLLKSIAEKYPWSSIINQ